MILISLSILVCRKYYKSKCFSVGCRGLEKCVSEKLVCNSSIFDGYNEFETIELLTNTFEHVKNDLVVDTLFFSFVIYTIDLKRMFVPALESWSDI